MPGVEVRPSRQLFAQTIEGEIVIRDPAVTWARVRQAVGGLAVATLFSVVYVPFRVWLDRTTGSGAFRFFTKADAVLLVVAALLVAAAWLAPGPNWLSVGPAGLAFRSWFRRQKYSWRVIESFQVGNPSEPRLAYVLVRIPEGGVRAVKLPAVEW